MEINKKRQPCSGIIQNMITFRKKLKQNLGHTCTHTHMHTPQHQQCILDVLERDAQYSEQYMSWHEQKANLILPVLGIAKTPTCKQSKFHLP